MSRRKRTLPRGWYPGDARGCRGEIESFLEGWEGVKGKEGKGVGGIVPHAGWYFSGRLAARVFRSLSQREDVDTVVIYGGHLGAEETPHIVTDEAWETPLGDMEIDQNLVQGLLKEMTLTKEPYASSDNTIEVQLPMAKYFFPKAKLLAFRSPPSSEAATLGEIVERIARAKGISIVAIGSTDLTHYGPNYGFMPKGSGVSALKWVKEENDRGFVERALRMDLEGLLEHAETRGSACSAGAAVSAIATSKAMGAQQGVLVDYYTSYEILPDDSFVGYAGIIY